VAEDRGGAIGPGEACEHDLRIASADRIAASKIEGVDQLRQFYLGIEGKSQAGDAKTNVSVSA